MRRIVKVVLARLHLLNLARRLLRRDEPHGHALLVRLLPAALRSAGRGYLIEVGSTREKLPGQGSTVVLARLARNLGVHFITIDMDPTNTEQARLDLRNFHGAQAINAKGEDFLASFRGPIVAAYLDAFDIDHGEHSEYRIDRYRRYLSTEITNAACAEMHLACAQALVDRVVPGGLVVIDDTWADGDGFAGKGSAAVPVLLENGFTIVARTPTAFALQRIGVV
jgi:hypothetical protein